jgi:hypothetical protein
MPQAAADYLFKACRALDVLLAALVVVAFS